MEERKWTGAQRAAIDERGRTLLVSAGAGSGKTAVLTARIIASLTDREKPLDIGRILAVTFTRTAAGELRERIGRALNEALAKNPGDKRLMGQLLALPGARISTIHSFCFDMVREHASRLGLSADLRIGDTAQLQIMRRTAMDELIEKRYDSREDKGFTELAESLTGVKSADMLAGVLLSLYDRLCCHVEGAGLLKRFAADRKKVLTEDFFDTVAGHRLREIVLNRLESRLRQYDEAVALLNQGGDKTANWLPAFEAEREYLVRLAGAKNASYAAFSQMLSAFPDTRLGPVKTEYQTGRVAAAKTLRAETGKEIKELSEGCFAYTDKELREAGERSAVLTEQLYDIISDFEKDFSERKRRAGICDFTDLERYAMQILIDENGRPTEAARAVSENFDAVYIDEYQDTNYVQNLIFNTVGREDNRFMVGDAKQSIYGFRGAEPMLFARQRDAFMPLKPKCGEEDLESKNCRGEAGAEGDAGLSIFMSENFRCDKTIIDFVNCVSRHSLGGDFAYLPEEELICAKPEGNTGAEVPVRVVIAQNPEDGENVKNPEAAFVAQEIERLVGFEKKKDGTPIRYADIAILLRADKTAAEEFRRELDKRGIPCRTSEKTSPLESPELQLLYCILSAADNPHKDVYLAGALMSPVYGFTMEELVLIRGESSAVSLYGALCEYTEKHDFEKGRNFIEKNGSLGKASRSMKTDAVVWTVIRESRLLQSLCDGVKSEAQKRRIRKNLELFFEYARRYESTGSGGLFGFLNYLERMREDKIAPETGDVGSGGDEVSIMSIHLSKGLEFPVCFVSDASREFNVKALNESLLFDAQAGAAMRLRDSTGYALVDTPFRAAAAYSIELKQLSEEMRILYVALTRARERLYVTAKGNFDKMMRAANSFAFGDRAAALFFSSHMDAVLASLALEGGRIGVYPECVIPDPAKEIQTGETPEEAVSPEKVAEYGEMLQKRLSYEYPYKHLTEIPAKLSVSVLTPSVLDESDTEKMSSISEAKLKNSVDAQREAKLKVKPDLMRTEDEKKASSAEKGSATHIFLQFCDFDLTEKYGAAAEAKRLLDAGFADRNTIMLADLEGIDKFFKSGFYKRIKASDGYRREFRFNCMLPASDFTQDRALAEKLCNEKLLVQGVIDGFFISGEDIFLWDYKTDALTEAELSNTDLARKKMQERHKEQLSYYAAALRIMLGRPVKAAYIYSVPLGRELEIETDKK